MFRAFAKKVVRALRPPRKGRPAVGSVQEVAAVYDDVFENDAAFDTLDISNEPKLKYVLRYAQAIDGPVLDAGCGRGSVLRYMLDHSVDAFGVELSKSACDMYLQGLPHANADIISWADRGETYAGLVCTDVLEHIPPDQIDAVLEALKRLSSSAFLGIANHSSIHNGHELHVIQEGLDWWLTKIREHFGQAELVRPDPDDEVLTKYLRNEMFFFIQAAR